jgi:hypothetical protein
LDKADRRVPMYNWGVIYAIEDPTDNTYSPQ